MTDGDVVQEARAGPPAGSVHSVRSPSHDASAANAYNTIQNTKNNDSEEQS